MKNIQLIEGKRDKGTQEFLVGKGLEVDLIGIENADFTKGTIITQSSNPKDLQTLIFQAKKQSGLLIDDTNIDYGENNIGFPFPEADELKTFSKYNIIITDIPKSYTIKIQDEIQKVMDNNPGFVINYNLFCTNDFILNQIIYDLIMLDIQSKEYKWISNNASAILK